MTRACIRQATLPRAIDEAAEIIRAGGLVAFPTETVYGLGADACNPLAVARIFEVKRRPSIDPLIVHVADSAQALHYGEFPAEGSSDLMSRFWPGPLTLVVPKKKVVPAIVTAGLNTVGIRVPAHPSALALIRATGRAIAAPSANLFGYVSPTRAQHVAEQLADQIDLILDGGPCSVGVESTVLSIAGPVPRILRSGGVTAEEIEIVIGPVEKVSAPGNHLESPGQLNRHYATRTPLQILREDDPLAAPAKGERVGLISLSNPKGRHDYSCLEVLSPSGDMREAAANLFNALRHLDSQGLDRLVAFPVPEIGLGVAIMDRLRRCAASG
ncbi:MAG TPA: L-threonylcarbamoyladenylate synthase [Acidobacteriota bacterium]|nr:L-threonylcarbamoyladenylate synthase [Acidobacteriota bacterium]